jgi:hypothetical protein
MAAISPNLLFGDALPFRPGPDLPTLDRSLDYIPRYLFRTYVPTSNGSTNQSVVEAPGFNSVNGHVDLLRLPWDKAASMLWGHLEWTNRKDDNLMSWTSSLLFAVQHGHYRHRTDKDKPDYSDIRICIVDTRKFPRGTFAKDLELMKVFLGDDKVRSFRNMRLGHGGYYFGEYLSQGRLNIESRSAHTSLRLLLDMGLYDLEPRFQHEESGLPNAKRVVALRQPFKASPLVTCQASKMDVRKAITAAQASFGDDYALPFALMLLSLCPRPERDRAILAGFEATFTGTCLDNSACIPLLTFNRRRNNPPVPTHANSRWRPTTRSSAVR